MEFGSRRKLRLKKAPVDPTAGGPGPQLQTAIVTASVQTRIANFNAEKNLDNAGGIHSEIVASYVGNVADVHGLDALRAAYDVSKGFITEYDPPIVNFVSTIEDATSLAIAIAQWVSDVQGTADLNLLHAETFIQDTLVPSGYWEIP